MLLFVNTVACTKINEGGVIKVNSVPKHFFGFYIEAKSVMKKLKSNKTDATDVDVSYLFWLLTRNCKFKIVYGQVYLHGRLGD